MPAPGQTAPGSLAARIIAHLRNCTGPQRARDIAASLGVPPDMDPDRWRQKVNNELNRMAARGRLTRTTGTVDGWAKPVGLFQIAPD